MVGERCPARWPSGARGLCQGSREPIAPRTVGGLVAFPRRTGHRGVLSCRGRSSHLAFLLPSRHGVVFHRAQPPPRMRLALGAVGVRCPGISSFQGPCWCHQSRIRHRLGDEVDGTVGPMVAGATLSKFLWTSALGEDTSHAIEDTSRTTSRCRAISRPEPGIVGVSEVPGSFVGGRSGLQESFGGRSTFGSTIVANLSPSSVMISPVNLTALGQPLKLQAAFQRGMQLSPLFRVRRVFFRRDLRWRREVGSMHFGAWHERA